MTKLRMMTSVLAVTATMASGCEGATGGGGATDTSVHQDGGMAAMTDGRVAVPDSRVSMTDARVDVQITDSAIDPTGRWVNATGNLAGTPSNCGTIPAITSKSSENMLIASVITQGLVASTNGGATWYPLGTGPGSDPFNVGLAAIVFDPDDDHIWWIAGVRYGSPFHTVDNGVTLTRLADFPQNDGISVDFTDPQRRTILVGGHEQVQEVRYTHDGGATWTNIGVNLPADSGDSSFPYVVNSHDFLVGTAHNQIYRTVDAGDHWTRVADGGGGASPLRHSDGTIYWAGRETAGLMRSTDDGATWSVATPSGVVYGMTPIELPDGRIAMRGPTGMLVTPDGGMHWTPVTPPIPNDYWWFQTTYNRFERAFYSERFDCSGLNAVNEDAVMRYGWDYATSP